MTSRYSFQGRSTSRQPMGGHICCMCILTEKLCWPTPVMSALSISEPEAEGSGVGNSLSNIVKSCYQKSSGGGGGCGCGLDGDG